MIIQCNDQWRIKSDRYAWIVQEFIGLDKWASRGWFSSIDSAIRYLADLRIRMIDSDKIDEIQKGIAEIVEDTKKIKDACVMASIL